VLAVPESWKFLSTGKTHDLTSMTTPTIGVFDSGFGGLTVLRALIERLPHARFAFLGDTARLPYGSKSRRTIARYAAQQRAVSGARAGRGVPGNCLQHGKRTGARRHSGCSAGSGAGRDRAGRERSAQGFCDGRRAGDRHGSHGAQSRLRAACHAQGLRALEKACPLLVPLVEEG